eukprot:495134-Rhodomonas_salina.1
MVGSAHSALIIVPASTCDPDGGSAMTCLHRVTTARSKASALCSAVCPCHFAAIVETVVVMTLCAGDSQPARGHSELMRAAHNAKCICRLAPIATRAIATRNWTALKEASVRKGVEWATLLKTGTWMVTEALTVTGSNAAWNSTVGVRSSEPRHA